MLGNVVLKKVEKKNHRRKISALEPREVIASVFLSLK